MVGRLFGGSIDRVPGKCELDRGVFRAGFWGVWAGLWGCLDFGFDGLWGSGTRPAEKKNSIQK